MKTKDNASNQTQENCIHPAEHRRSYYPGRSECTACFATWALGDEPVPSSVDDNLTLLHGKIMDLYAACKNLRLANKELCKRMLENGDRLDKVESKAAGQRAIVKNMAAILQRLDALETRDAACACPHCKGEGRLTLVDHDGERVMGAYCPRCLPPGMQRA